MTLHACEGHLLPVLFVAVCCSVIQCDAVCCMRVKYMYSQHAREVYVLPKILCAHTVTHCNTLQHAATRCNTLQQTAEDAREVHPLPKNIVRTHCNTLQHAATRCNTLQKMHVKCSYSPKISCAHTCNTLCTLQHTATHCNTLQHAATHCRRCM